MEIKILDSILHGALKPWKVDNSDTRRVKELLKAAKAIAPVTSNELNSQLTILLANYTGLKKIVTNSGPDSPLKQLLFHHDLPKGNDLISQYFSTLITAECLRTYNTFLQQAENWTNLIDIRYQAGKLLNSIKVLTKQTIAEYTEQGFASKPDAQSNHIQFALYSLHFNLLQLYFSIQDSFKESLEQITSQEDFHVLDLEQPLSTFIELEHSEPIEEKTGRKKDRKQKFSFGFRGDGIKLQSAISQLCFKIDLVNDKTNTEDDLFQVLTSKDIKPCTYLINIGCETTQFAYIMKELKKYFSNLTATSIGSSGIFISRNAEPLTRQNLYSSKIDNPKSKEEIDKIIKNLQ